MGHVNLVAGLERRAAGRAREDAEGGGLVVGAGGAGEAGAFEGVAEEEGVGFFGGRGGGEGVDLGEVGSAGGGGEVVVDGAGELAKGG